MAVFCHGGIIRVMLAMLLDMPLMRMAHFNIEYGSVTVVELQPEKKHAIEIELMNFCALRDGGGKGEDRQKGAAHGVLSGQMICRMV